MADEVTLSMQKAILWNEAKGKLRALADVEGYRGLVSVTCERTDDGFGKQWVELHKAVEDFIASIEDHGLAE